LKNIQPPSLTLPLKGGGKGEGIYSLIYEQNFLKILLLNKFVFGN